MRRWPIAIIIFFVLLAAGTGVVVYLAMSNPDPVVESYQTNDR